MKIILTGVTGFIGGEVLAQCRRNPSITSIIALTRRALSDDVAKDPKVEIIIMKDFKTYSPEVLSKLEGADGCVWSMGTTEAIKEIEIDYPLAFAKAFAPTLSKTQRPFTYVHCSGILAEKNQTKTLMFFQGGRRIKGLAELEMMAVEKQVSHQGNWKTFIVKPAMVLPKSGGDLRWLAGPIIGSVKVDELAAAMIDITQHGNHEQILQNAQVIQKGRTVLNSVTK